MSQMKSSQARNQWLAWYIINDEDLDAELSLAVMEAIWAESKFRNLANPKVPSSLRIDNDGMGVDHNSVGVMQQQVNSDGSSRGWGNVKQAMDPETAIRTFIGRAKGSTKRGSGAHRVAQNVQRSAFSDGSNYRAKERQAKALIERMSQSCN